MTATQCARFIFINGKEKKKGFKFALPWGVNCALQKTVWSILISGLICCRAMSLRTKRKRECKLSNKTFYVTRERSAKKCVKCQIFDHFFLLATLRPSVLNIKLKICVLIIRMSLIIKRKLVRNYLCSLSKQNNKGPD